MKKIGIVTFFNVINYGAFLQSLALQKVLEKKYDVSIINYENTNIKKQYNIIKTKSLKKVIKSIVFIRKNIIKKLKFKNIINKYLKLSDKNDNYDVVIAGSDQIWNINFTNGFDSIYSLDYFQNVKKISYATSIGQEELIFKNPDIYKKILNNVDYISVRENSAKIELCKLTDKIISVNCDPTLLLESSEWKKYIKQRPINQSYIFSYFVNVNIDNYSALNKFSNLLNMKVVGYSENPKEKNTIKNSFTDNPFEFITKLFYSDYVFTSSYHGTIFSILFNKQFICMLPKEKSNRILDLLSELGLTDRIIYKTTDLEEFDFSKKINYIDVNKKIEKLREKSLEWLDKSIGE